MNSVTILQKLLVGTGFGASAAIAWAAIGLWAAFKISKKLGISDEAAFLAYMFMTFASMGFVGLLWMNHG